MLIKIFNIKFKINELKISEKLECHFIYVTVRRSNI